jgi:hypothetical protein
MAINFTKNQNVNNINTDDEDDFPVRQVPYEANQDNQDNQVNQSKPVAPFGGLIPTNYGTAPTTTPVTTASAFSFGGHQASQPGIAFSSCFAPPPKTNTNNLSFNGSGGFGTRVERHPETGQPLPSTQMGCNLQPPQAMCGGIQFNRNPNPNGLGLLGNRSNDKKTIEELYKKLAYARAQIQNLNKVIDEIYETLPNITI